MFHHDRGVGEFDAELKVKGIPFRVKEENGTVAKIDRREIDFEGRYEALFFLGMSTDSWQCSEWWGQQEAQYDHSTRLFIGDRIGRISVIYEDATEDMISVIFGVNAWNYNLFFKPKDCEGNLNSFAAPYDEPFRSDPEAAKLLSNSLRLMENEDEGAVKATKWVMGYRVRPEKRVVRIQFDREAAKSAGFVVSAVTGVEAGCPLDPAWKLLDQDFFLSKRFYADADKLARRLYQFRDELPEHDPLLELPDYDAPDIRFSGDNMAEIYTNVYRKNIMDMAYGKVTDDGMPHTSTANTANFGCYIGFGSFAISGQYAQDIWTRDVGRLLTEILHNGYHERALSAADPLHEMLYYPSIRFKLPHWKRIANKIARDEQELFNEGKENDGHASIMMYIYGLYNQGAVDVSWLKAHRKQLKDAADYFIWQVENPDQSNFDRVLYSESEASRQQYGGYDLYSNVISATALICYARLFEAMGEEGYAGKLKDTASLIKRGVDERFMMDHPRFGKVYTDTTDDCWTYEYKRFCELLMHSDVYGYDVHRDNPALFEVMSRTFEAQREQYYQPEAGRQMGYGQGYLTLAVLSLDLYDEFSECMDAATAFCYHHSDFNYIVPEGVIMHGSKRFWFRNCDLGNGVQQAEIIKCARLIAGIDDLDRSRGLRLIPRLPNRWNSIQVKDYPVTLRDYTTRKFAYTYRRIKPGETGRVVALCGDSGYAMDFDTGVELDYLRMGPFDGPDIQVQGGQATVEKIQGRYFAYVKLN